MRPTERIGIGVCLLVATSALTACASRPAVSGLGGRAAAVSPDTTLEGGFRWVGVDGRPGPAEFPVGSGATLIDGTLELRDVAAARAGAGGRFKLRFTLRPSPADTARSTGEDGQFRVVGDSLRFTPDGRADHPPVRFKYAWRRDGVLALTDSRGQLWSYVRR